MAIENKEPHDLNKNNGQAKAAKPQSELALFQVIDPGTKAAVLALFQQLGIEIDATGLTEVFVLEPNLPGQKVDA